MGRRRVRVLAARSRQIPGDGQLNIDPRAFRRIDETRDADFYAQPRFVEHIDAGAIAAVTDLYREYFAPGFDLLDLMSSWVSHLPDDIAYGRVAATGMNAAELAANPRLTDWIVHDLNADPSLPFADATFDGAALCVSIQYLTQPVAVLAEVARVLRPDGPLVVTFSNRCFPTKAVAAWHALDARGHVAFVRRALEASGAWRDAIGLDRSRPGGDPLYAVIAHADGSRR